MWFCVGLTFFHRAFWIDHILINLILLKFCENRHEYVVKNASLIRITSEFFLRCFLFCGAILQTNSNFQIKYISKKSPLDLMVMITITMESFPPWDDKTSFINFFCLSFSEIYQLAETINYTKTIKKLFGCNYKSFSSWKQTTLDNLRFRFYRWQNCFLLLQWNEKMR